MRKIITLLFLTFIILNCSNRTENQQEDFANQVMEQKDTVDVTDLLDTQPISKLNLSEPEPEEKNSDNQPIRKKVSLDSLKGTPCNIHAVLYAYENIDSMSTKALDIFLQIFSRNCDDNAEFGEFSQEMIFEVFAKYPSDVAELITNNEYDISAITYELKGPLLDPVIEPIIEDFKATGLQNPKIDSVIVALEKGAAWLREN